MSEQIPGPGITVSIEFTAEELIKTLAELKAYIERRGVAEPITATSLFGRRIITLEELDDIDTSDWPEDNEFTPAEVSFLGRVIDYCAENPDKSYGLIVMDVFDDVTDVEIWFPPELEPPAELR